MKRFYHTHRAVVRDMTTILTVLLSFLSALLFFSLHWLMHTWSELTVDEVLYHLFAPLQGTSTAMVREYILQCAVPAGIVTLLVIVIFLLCRHRRNYRRLVLLALAAAFFTTGYTVHDAWDDLDIGNYIKSQLETSRFIDDHYVDPKTVALRFPEKKRNLIYIFMESTEVTFADQASGGAFPENTIPELTQIAEDNEDFSGTDTTLNGGYAMPGATWTMGAMFAQTSGLPLKISIDQNAMDSQKSFFPDILTIGDLLEKQGYTQELMLGSVGYFGGRKLYFQTHGNYAIKDFSYWKNQHKFPANYWVNWGFEDRKLYQYAKEELDRLGNQEQPFNLTMLTVDTHFPDGYVCPLCPNRFEDQYANVYNCASQQLKSFLDWCKTQDWYENTTIVISGDHPTMDHDFCKDVPDDYERTVFTAYVNAPVQPVSTERRDFTTFDDFPTTLAALGVEIEGNRLGLGTNLYSDLPTLSEQYGRAKEKEELEKKSALMVKLGQIDEQAAIESKEAKEQKEKEKKEKEAQKAAESRAAESRAAESAKS